MLILLSLSSVLRLDLMMIICVQNTSKFVSSLTDVRSVQIRRIVTVSLIIDVRVIVRTLMIVKVLRLLNTGNHLMAVGIYLLLVLVMVVIVVLRKLSSTVLMGFIPIFIIFFHDNLREQVLRIVMTALSSAFLLHLLVHNHRLLHSLIHTVIKVDSI
jgi:hypothetical protein